MKIEQIYTGCLAQGAYYIESDGEAAIIDPLREIAPYISRATHDNAHIKYIFETHFHADFVSGHIDLAKKTGATIVYGPTAQPAFDALVAQHEQVFELGKVKIKLLHTPGHTMESSCFLLVDENGKDIALFSGDTVFIGDVGRPDLAQKAAQMTQEQLAALLYHSLRSKIMPLADDIIVYPAHGAGSACGKNMSKETTDTLGHQKATNYALRADMTEAQFVKEVTTGLMPPPAYFPANVAMNKKGYESIDTILQRGKHALSPAAFEAAADETAAIILDTRDPKNFAKGHIPGSINIGINGAFAPWVGALIPDIQQKILLVTEPGREEETITRLARVGYDQCIGHLEGGYESWISAGKEIGYIPCVSAEELAKSTIKPHHIVDVRKLNEYNSQHIEGSLNLPLDDINNQQYHLGKKDTYYVHCAAGYRSMIFISILKARGYNNLVNVDGGMDAIKKCALFKLTDYVCPTSML
jgi:hydroxyacylglutathione hydrolase